MVVGHLMRTGLGRRGVTLVEVMALVIVVAIAVPPIAAISVSSSRALVEERRTFHTAWLASAVLEQIVADAGTGDEGLDLEAMGDAAYLDNGTSGLRVRMDSVATDLLAGGLAYEVVFGLPRDATGALIDVNDSAATRLVTVTVSYTNELGRGVDATFSTVVGQP